MIQGSPFGRRGFPCKTRRSCFGSIYPKDYLEEACNLFMHCTIQTKYIPGIFRYHWKWLLQVILQQPWQAFAWSMQSHDPPERHCNEEGLWRYPPSCRDYLHLPSRRSWLRWTSKSYLGSCTIQQARCHEGSAVLGCTRWPRNTSRIWGRWRCFASRISNDQCNCHGGFFQVESSSESSGNLTQKFKDREIQTNKLMVNWDFGEVRWVEKPMSTPTWEWWMMACSAEMHSQPTG